MMQIMVKQRHEMVEGSSRYDPPQSILVPPEKTRKSPFWVIFGTVGTVICGDYKKPENRASLASMSLESLFRNANYSETMAGNG